jgi:hypothetical protein
MVGMVEVERGRRSGVASRATTLHYSTRYNLLFSHYNTVLW